MADVSAAVAVVSVNAAVDPAMDRMIAAVADMAAAIGDERADAIRALATGENLGAMAELVARAAHRRLRELRKSATVVDPATVVLGTPDDRLDDYQAGKAISALAVGHPEGRCYVDPHPLDLKVREWKAGEHMPMAEPKA